MEFPKTTVIHGAVRLKFQLGIAHTPWKFTRNKVLYGRHYKTFDAFKKAIDGCLDRVTIEHRAALKLLMTHNFQTFDKASLLAA